jgi:MSHA biogenesis protein MshJ
MRAFLSRALKSFNALSLRERALLILAIGGAVLMLVEFAWVRPHETRTRALRERLAAQESETQALTKALQAISGPGQPRATPVQKEERDRLRTLLVEADDLVRNASSDVKLGDVVRRLVVSSPGVALVSLRTLPSERFFSPGTAAASAQAASAAASAPASLSTLPGAAPLPPLYRHGVELTLGGTYRTLIPYLRTLETAMPGVYWASAKLDVVEYPASTLRVVLYTVSVQPEVTFE